MSGHYTYNKGRTKIGYVRPRPKYAPGDKVILIEWGQRPAAILHVDGFYRRETSNSSYIREYRYTVLFEDNSGHATAMWEEKLMPLDQTAMPGILAKP